MISFRQIQHASVSFFELMEGRILSYFLSKHPVQNYGNHTDVNANRASFYQQERLDDLGVSFTFAAQFLYIHMSNSFTFKG